MTCEFLRKLTRPNMEQKIIAPLFDINVRNTHYPITIFKTKKCILKIQRLSDIFKERVNNFTKSYLGFEKDTIPALYELEFSCNEKIDDKILRKAKYCLLWAWQAMWLALPTPSYMPFLLYPKKNEFHFSQYGIEDIEWEAIFFDRMGYGANAHYPSKDFSSEYFKEAVKPILNIALKDIDKVAFFPPESALGRFRHWHYAAITEKEAPIRLVHHISALECFLKKWKSDDIADEIVNFLVKKNPKFAKQGQGCKIFIKAIHELRSNLVHGASLYGSIKTDEKDERELFKWIEAIYRNLPLKDFFYSMGKTKKKVQLLRPPWYLI